MAAHATGSSLVGKYVYLPIYTVSPEIIFSGKLAVLDVDFFNPNDEMEERTWGTREVVSLQEIARVKGVNNVVDTLRVRYGKIITSDALVTEKAESGNILGTEYSVYANDRLWDLGDGYVVCVTPNGEELRGENIADNGEYKIFKIEWNYHSDMVKKSIASQIRPTVAMWYTILRNIAIVIALTILIYIGIRIIISSNSSDKSKYKQRLLDWVVSICLIFVMHYIMAGSNLFVKKLSNLIGDFGALDSVYIMQFENDKQRDNVLEALYAHKDALVAHKMIEPEAVNEQIKSQFTAREGNYDYLVWPTNLMGMVRMQAQEVGDEDNLAYIGYVIMYGVLVIFTIIFVVTYFKRIIYLAFLTVIAPFVAMTYSLDKLKDGSAQGFNAWFKEYMVNLMIQPIHLLLYTVLISSALNLARTNVMYAIVAIGFMIPAEKLVRKFFGFNATETQGLLAGPAGAALMMTGFNRLIGHRPPKPKDRVTKDEDKVREHIPDSDAIFGNREYSNNNQKKEENSDNSQSNSIKDNGNTRTENNYMDDIRTTSLQNINGPAQPILNSNEQMGRDLNGLQNSTNAEEHARIDSGKKHNKQKYIRGYNRNMPENMSKHNKKQIERARLYRKQEEQKARKRHIYKRNMPENMSKHNKEQIEKAKLYRRLEEQKARLYRQQENNTGKLEGKRRKELPKPIKRVITGAKGVARETLRDAAENILPNLGEFATKGIVRSAGLAVGGIAGGIATVVGGGEHPIATIGGASLAGWGAGGPIAELIHSKRSVKSDDVYPTPKEEEREIKRKINQILNDEDVVRAYAKRRNISTMSKAKEELSEGTFLHDAILKGHADNAKDLAVAKAATEGKTGEDYEMGWSFAEFERQNQSMIANARSNNKDYDNFIKTLRQNLGDEELSNEESKKVAKEMAQKIFKLNSFRTKS